MILENSKELADKAVHAPIHERNAAILMRLEFASRRPRHVLSRSCESYRRFTAADIRSRLLNQPNGRGIAVEFAVAGFDGREDDQYQIGEHHGEQEKEADDDENHDE